MRFRRQLTMVLACSGVLVASCKEGAGPQDGGHSIAILAGDAQFGLQSTNLNDPFQVIVTDPVSKFPKSGVTVQWSIVEGTGASLSTVTSSTGSDGVASVRLKLGDALGIYKVRATVPKVVGSPVTFTARSVMRPTIVQVAPTSARSGDTITVTGSNFSPGAEDNIVIFAAPNAGGFRGRVLNATETQLRVIVPACLPARSVLVQVLLGAIASTNQVTLAVTGGSVATPLALARGAARVFTDPNELACLNLPDNQPGLSVLLVPQNYSEVIGTVTSFQIVGLTGGGGAAIVNEIQHTQSPVESWELKLRRKERELLRGPGFSNLADQASAMAACSATVGSRCDFKVINKDDKFESVTAEVKVISAHAIVYQDITAPANGLTQADFAELAATFDDPIYDTDVATFGQPSDLDGNGKVIILLTPVVNRLTPRNASGFIAGFFYGCDLLNKDRCSGSNGGEIFYAFVPHPGDATTQSKSRADVMASLPPVMAHEFQHMINFAERGSTAESLWLSEGMAHQAEDVVADVYAARGDNTNTARFRALNDNRASRYLRDPAGTSLLAEEEIGTLEQRGAAWLFVKYLAGRFGNGILGTMSRSTKSSVDNVVTSSGTAWNTLMSDWSVALWADDNPDLAGATLNPAQTYPNMNMRTRFGNVLPVTTYSFEDFIHRETLPASSQAYLLVRAPAANTKTLHMTFSGANGGAFAINSAPQLTLLRVQ